MRSDCCSTVFMNTKVTLFTRNAPQSLSKAVKLFKYSCGLLFFFFIIATPRQKGILTLKREAFFSYLQGVYLAVYIHGKQMLLPWFIHNTLWWCLAKQRADLCGFYLPLSLLQFIHCHCRNFAIPKEHFGMLAATNENISFLLLPQRS